MIVNPGGFRVSWTRALAAATAALTVAGLAVLVPAAPARSAEGLAFTWEVSDVFGSSFGNRAASRGATSGCGGPLEFGGGSGEYHPGSGETSVRYTGSVTGSDPGALGCLLPAPSPEFSLTLADPIVTVDHEGVGRISAVVSSANAAADGQPAASTSPKRVVVTTFTATRADWTNAGGIGTLNATPNAWTPAFLAQLTPTVRSHFQPSTDAAKRPAPITAQAIERTVSKPTLEADILEANKDYVLLLVRGLGYTVTDQTRPVSVGFGPSGADLDRPRLVVKQTVYANAMSEDAFAVYLTVPTGALDPARRHSAYTYDGAVRRSARFDAEAPVSVPFQTLGFPRPSRVALRLLKRPGVKTAGKVLVRVSGGELVPSGRLRVAWEKGRAGRTWTRRLNLQGSITQQLPASPKGRWILRVRYLGSPAYAPSGRRMAVRIGSVELRPAARPG